MAMLERPDLAKMERLFALSASVGELLQRRITSPVDALTVLLITLGRLLAREGYSDLSADAGWDFLMHDDVKYFFDWGHQEERARGHRGPPRKGPGRG